MENILKLLQIDALNEEQQKEIKDRLNDIIDLKVTEKVDEALETEKTALLETYEQKFEEYKQDITAKFSNFVDTILEDELVIPENIVEYARKGELYNDLIEDFKVRLGIDEGVLDQEARNLLSEAKDEILRLQDEINEITEEKLVIESDAQEFAAELYKVKKTDGLPFAQKTKILALLEGVTSVPEIDRKFKLIVDGKLHEEDEDDSATNECKCPECGKTASVKGACSTETCSDCDVKMQDAEKNEDGKGQVTVKTDKLNEEESDEDKSPFEIQKKRWINILKESSF